MTIDDSHPIGVWQATGIPVLDYHELAAGKLSALLARRQARDLFDCHRILTADKILQQHIQSQPLLEWKALNVRSYKK